MDVRVGQLRRLNAEEWMLLNCGAGEDSWESLGTARRSNQSILKEINPEHSLEGLMLKQAPILWPPDVNSWKTLWWWQEKGITEDEMVGWHHRLKGLEFEQTPCDSEGHGSLVCCSPWGCKDMDMAKWLNNNKQQNKTKSDTYSMNFPVVSELLVIGTIHERRLTT